MREISDLAGTQLGKVLELISFSLSPTNSRTCKSPWVDPDTTIVFREDKGQMFIFIPNSVCQEGNYGAMLLTEYGKKG